MLVFDVCPVSARVRTLPGFSLFFIVIVSLPQHLKLYLQYMRENTVFSGKRRSNQSTISFFFSPFLFLSVPQIDAVGG